MLEETVEGWHERMKFLMDGFKPEDIWNTDETGRFYRALPDKTLAEKNERMQRWEKVKRKDHDSILC